MISFVVFSLIRIDIFDFCGLLQELQALTLALVHPIAVVTVRDEGALHVAGGDALDVVRSLGVTKVPHGIHVLVLDQRLRYHVALARHDVQNATREIGSIEHLVQVGGRERAQQRQCCRER